MSTKPQATKPVQNMTEINKLLSDAIEALKITKADNAAINMKLTQEREKNQSLVLQLDRANVLLIMAENVIKNQRDLNGKMHDANTILESKFKKVDNALAASDSSRRVSQTFLWVIIALNVAAIVMKLVANHGGF